MVKFRDVIDQENYKCACCGGAEVGRADANSFRLCDFYYGCKDVCFDLWVGFHEPNVVFEGVGKELSIWKVFPVAN